jgi:Tol biopolymer transport system component
MIEVGEVFFHAPSPGNALRRREGSRDEVFLSLDPGNGIDTMALSNDGSTLALLTFGENQLAKVCVTPVAHPALRCFPHMVGSSRPTWSSRGDAVYVDSKRAIGRVPVDGGPLRVVVPDVVATGGLAVSPSGARLVYSDCTTRGQLVAVGADPPRPFVETDNALEPAFGPHDRFAFVSQTLGAGDQRVMVREADGVLREVVRHEDARLSGVTFSADGRYLAYVVGSKTEPGIYVARLDSAAVPNRVTEDDSDRLPLFIGDALVFTRTDAQGAPHLMRVSVDGGDLASASRRPRRTVAVDLARGRVLLSSPAGDFFYWWDPATGEETKGPALPQPMGDVAISPDGQWLVSLEGGNGRVAHRLRLDGKPQQPERLYEVPGDLTSGSAAIDDRGQVVMTLFEWTGELWSQDAPAGSPW